MTDVDGVSRRTLLGSVAGAATTSLSGCLYGGMPFQHRSRGVPPVLDHRPAAVYYPSVSTPAKLVAVRQAGPFGVALLAAPPSRFWTVTGTRFEKTPVEAADDVHLMVVVWDRESGLVLPEAGVSLELARDGDLVSQEVTYRMLAQRSGFHYGSNFQLGGNGRYAVRVAVGGLSIRRLGPLRDRLTEPASVTIPFQFRAREYRDVRRPSARPGDPGALSPATHDGVPRSASPRPDALPGRVLGSATTGDAVLSATAVAEDRFPGHAYLAVVAATPYNRYPLPGMAMSARLEREGEVSFEGSLVRTLDPVLGYHYGAAIPAPGDTDRLELTVTTPPQVARHEGYETAFREMPGVTI